MIGFLDIIDIPEWYAGALCAQTDPEAFYPDKGSTPGGCQEGVRRLPRPRSVPGMGARHRGALGHLGRDHAEGAPQAPDGSGGGMKRPVKPCLGCGKDTYSKVRVCKACHAPTHPRKAPCTECGRMTQRKERVCQSCERGESGPIEPPGPAHELTGGEWVPNGKGTKVWRPYGQETVRGPSREEVAIRRRALVLASDDALWDDSPEACARRRHEAAREAETRPREVA